jgi:Spy/CpxP family protein refolding chaperone
MMGDMMGGGKGMKKGMGHGMMMHSVPMMEGRLAYIKADLEITEAQMPAWDAYADAVRVRHTTMESMHADMMKAKESGSALERMDARLKAMESMVDSLKALKPSTEALYAVLTDEQKKKADQLLGGRCGMM